MNLFKKKNQTRQEQIASARKTQIVMIIIALWFGVQALLATGYVKEFLKGFADGMQSGQVSLISSAYADELPGMLPGANAACGKYPGYHECWLKYTAPAKPKSASPADYGHDSWNKTSKINPPGGKTQTCDMNVKIMSRVPVSVFYHRYSYDEKKAAWHLQARWMDKTGAAVWKYDADAKDGWCVLWDDMFNKQLSDRDRNGKLYDAMLKYFPEGS